MTRAARRLGNRGVSAIEAAFALPAVAIFAVGLFEFGRVLAVDNLLDHAAQAVSRAGVTGQAPPPGMTREQQLARLVGDRTFGLVDPATLEVEMVSYESFPVVRQPEPFIDLDGDGRWGAGEPFTDVNGNGQWDPDQGRPGSGRGGEVVLYAIRYADKPMTGLMAAVLGVQEFRYEARAAVRNEPFGGR